VAIEHGLQFVYGLAAQNVGEIEATAAGVPDVTRSQTVATTVDQALVQAFVFELDPDDRREVQLTAVGLDGRGLGSMEMPWPIYSQRVTEPGSSE
jgi:hypothetical protein